jgi:hypothetical protein
MTGWYAERTPHRSAKAVIAATLLALFGGSILAAAIAVAGGGMSGMRHLRKLVAGRSIRPVRVDGSQYTDVAEPESIDHTAVVQLDPSEYTEVC